MGNYHARSWGRDHVGHATSQLVRSEPTPYKSETNTAGFVTPSLHPSVMKFSSLLRSLTALALVTVAIAEDGSDVVDITPTNFNTVTKEPLVLVEFFAPW